LAVVGYEWIVIGVIVVAFLVWGPSKIPEIARGFGRARREFEDASRGLTIPSAGTTSVLASEGSADPLISAAQRLGVKTEGKTRQEISDEIVKAAKP